MSNAETNKRLEFHLPVRPYSPIDALNRRAAALGSPRYAMATTYADYNGHHVSVAWNDYRKYYVTEYYWGERVVLARGDFERCLRAAIAEYQRGALGSSVGVYPRDDDSEAIRMCEETVGLVPGALWVKENGNTRFNDGAWYTWRHECAAASARDYANPRGLVMVFDWELMQAAADRAAYEAALKEKYGRIYQ